MTFKFTLLYTLAVLAAYGIDSRTIGGDNVWLKPLKFGISTSLYLASLLWVQASLSDGWRRGRSVKAIAATASVCTLFELIYIAIQAGRAQPSHFNVTTPFYAVMYGLMAIAAVALVLSGGALGVVAFLDKASALTTPMRWGVMAAFTISTGLTLLTALTMGGRLTHDVGAGTLRLPFTGWSLTAGDMRAPHFLATHLMQTGPGFAWLAARVMKGRAATAAVIGFCLGWAAITLRMYRIVLSGRPFFAFFG